MPCDAGVGASPLQKVTKFTATEQIHPAGGNELGRIMGQSMKSATTQMQAFEVVHRLMDDGVEGILRFCEDLGGEIRSLAGEGSQPACSIWCGGDCKDVGDQVCGLCTDAITMFQESRKQHEMALRKVKAVLVNFQQKFVSSTGDMKEGAAWEPVTEYCKQYVSQHGDVGRARLLSQLLEPAFQAPPKERPVRRKLADL